MAVVKVEPPKNGISALIKTQRASQPSAKESATLKRALTQPCRHPDLPVSKTEREIPIIYKLPTLWYFCYSILYGLRQDETCCSVLIIGIIG